MNPGESKKDFLEYIFEYPPTIGESRREMQREWSEISRDIDTNKLWEWMQHTLDVPKPFGIKPKKESEWDK